ncbi:hypothetical protein F6455_02840 [Proteobacteria bacterium 005FR1]|nr:hypothetical protein [Proteobacteria bacterium 005FR1]
MLKLIGALWVMSGVVMLVAALFGFRPDAWRFEYFLYTNVLGVLAGGAVYLFGHLQSKRPKSSSKFAFIGILVFLLAGIAASLLFQAGSPANI